MVPSGLLEAGQTEKNLNAFGLETFQKEPDWYWNFDGGVFVFDAKSVLAKLVKSGTQVVIFEDMAIYTMVKNNTFNGMPLPSIYLKGRDGGIRLVKKFGYEDFKGRLS